MVIVRWVWVVLLSALALIGLALAPATGLLTVPFALTTLGLALWLRRRSENHRDGGMVAWLVGLGMLGMAVILVLAVLS